MNAPNGATRRAGVYERLRASFVREMYWSVTRHPRVTERREEVKFYREVLCGFRPGDLIFDVGANRGDKVDVFLRLGARIVAVEPDDTCQRVLSGRFHRLRFRPKPVTLVAMAVSGHSGIQTFLEDEPGSALNTLSSKWANTLRETKRFGAVREFRDSRKVETTTLQDLIQQHGSPFYIKIDVEGHEVSALEGLQFPVPFLSFEVNLPEFRPEAKEAVARLSQLSYQGQFSYAANLGDGLVAGWQAAREFLKTLDTVQDSSIEVFWRT